MAGGWVSARPRDICRFLVYKDKTGKTPVHVTDCPIIGERLGECSCPKRLAVGTVGTIVGKLRGSYAQRGFGNTWHELEGNGNPANSVLVQNYVKLIRNEQSKAHVQPKQAIPLFIDKLEAICGYVDRHLKSREISGRIRYIYLRDQAFFKLQFFAGDRAPDLGKMLTQEIKLGPSGGLQINHTWGKTFRLDKPNKFTVFPCDRQSLCPVRALNAYVDGARQMGVELNVGYLFRPVRTDGTVPNEPLKYGAVYERLKLYLGILNLDDGETPHSLRGGCAITMGGGGSEGEKGVMEHVGWSKQTTARYYARHAQWSEGMAKSHEFSENMSGASPYMVAHSFRQTSGEGGLPKAFP